MGDARLRHDPSRPARTAGGAIVAALALLCPPCGPALRAVDSDRPLTNSRWPASRSAPATGASTSRRTATRPNRVMASSLAYGACCSALILSATTHGTASQDHLVPTSYVANFSSDDAIDDVRMVLHDGVASDVEAKPPIPAARDRVPVTAAELRGAIDPLTAGLMLVPGNRGYPGVRGLPTHAADLRRHPPVRHGPVVQAHGQDQGRNRLPGAGHRLRHVLSARRRLQYGRLSGRLSRRKPRDMEMWFAPIAGMRLLPTFRITIPTMLGIAVLGGTRFESAIR